MQNQFAFTFYIRCYIFTTIIPCTRFRITLQEQRRTILFICILLILFFLILPKNHCVFQLVVDLGSWWCWIHELKSCGTKNGKKGRIFLLYLSSSRIFQITNPNFGQPNPLLILNIHIREATFYFLKYRKCNSLINKKVGGFGTPCFLRSKINLREFAIF